MINIKTNNFIKISQNVGAKVKELEEVFKNPKVQRLEKAFKNIESSWTALKGKKEDTIKIDDMPIVVGGVKFKFWKCAKEEAIKNIASAIKNKRPTNKADEDIIEEMSKFFEEYHQEATVKSATYGENAWKKPEVNPFCSLDYVRKNPSLYAAISNFGK